MHLRSVSAVLFDWRGTLVTTLSEREWAEEALRRLGRRPPPREVDDLLAVLDRRLHHVVAACGLRID